MKPPITTAKQAVNLAKATGHTGHQAVTKHPLHPVKQPLRQESLCLNIQSTSRFAACLYAVKPKQPLNLVKGTDHVWISGHTSPAQYASTKTQRRWPTQPTEWSLTKTPTSVYLPPPSSQEGISPCHSSGEYFAVGEGGFLVRAAAGAWGDLAEWFLCLLPVLRLGGSPLECLAAEHLKKDVCPTEYALLCILQEVASLCLECGLS